METMTEADEAAFNDAFDETETPETAETGNAPEEAAEPEAGAETEAEQSEPEEGGVPAAGEAETDVEPENGETAVNDYSDLLDDGKAPEAKPEGSGAPKVPEKREEPKAEVPPAAAAKGIAYQDIVANLPTDYEGLNLKEFAELYPEEVKCSMYLAEQIANQILLRGGGTGGGNPELGQRLEQMEQFMRQQFAAQAQETFDNAVLAEHPDAREIVSSDPKFKEWLKGQSSGIKRMFLESTDPKDACMILDMYKGTAGSRKSGVAASKRSAYAGSGKAGGRPGMSGRSAEDEFDAGWNED